MASDPICVFDVDADLLLALERTYGPPIDSYLNGWQVWIEPCELRDEEGEPIELEYRLHTVEGFTQPEGLSHHDLWDEVITQLADGVDRCELGTERRRVDELWRLLEVYPAFGDPLEPDEIARVTAEALGREPVASGWVDHGRLGAAWKRTKGGFDLASALLDALGVDGDP
jgi:hypothetical protein